jgi:hypothetical protein
VRTPPLDLELDKLNKARLRRIASCMGIKPVFEAWLSRKRHCDQDPDVRANTSASSVISG